MAAKLVHGQKGVLVVWDKQYVCECWFNAFCKFTLKAKDCYFEVDHDDVLCCGERTTRDWKWYPFPDDNKSSVPEPSVKHRFRYND